MSKVKERTSGTRKKYLLNKPRKNDTPNIVPEIALELEMVVLEEQILRQPLDIRSESTKKTNISAIAPNSRT